MRRKRALRCRGCGRMFGRSKHPFVYCEAGLQRTYARRRGLVRIGGSFGLAALEAGHAHIYMSDICHQQGATLNCYDHEPTPVRAAPEMPVSTAPQVWTHPWVRRLYLHLHSTENYQRNYTRFVALLRDPIQRERELAMLSLRGNG